MIGPMMIVSGLVIRACRILQVSVASPPTAVFTQTKHHVRGREVGGQRNDAVLQLYQTTGHLMLKS